MSIANACESTPGGARTIGRSSQRAFELAAMFGVRDGSMPRAPRVPGVPPGHIDLPVHGVVLITGPSGAGKSTLLHSMTDRCRERDMRIVCLDDLPPIDERRPLIDLVGRSLDEATSLLSSAGLAEAAIMLAAPDRLSAGQRCRFQLARAMDIAATPGRSDHMRAPVSPGSIVVADEFGASLDRLTATIIARNVRRWIDGEQSPPITFIAACANDDLIESLQPDVLIWMSLSADVHVHRRTR